MASKEVLSLKQNFPPLIVYNNLKSLFKHREVKLEYGSFTEKNISKDKWVSDTDFIHKIQFNRYIIVSATDNKDKIRRYSPNISKDTHKLPTKTFIIIIDRGSDFTRSEHFEKMLNKLPEIKSKTRNFNMDVLTISENPITSFSSKKLDQFRFEGSADRGFVSITPVLYTLFMNDIFSYNIVSDHRIMSKEEEKEILDNFKLQKTNLPKISKLDPACVIIGAEIGDLVEIQNLNQISGIEITYRFVNR